MSRFGNKGKVFSWLLMIVFMGITITAMALLWGKFFAFEGKLGDKQSVVFNTYTEGERALFFVESAAKRAVPQAFYDFANAGGVSDGNCSYFGFMLVNGSCKSSYLESDYLKFYGKTLDSFLLSYSTVDIPLRNYKFSIADGTLNGTALSNIFIDVSLPYVAGIGVPGDVQIFNCTDGDCVSEVAKSFVERYGDLPYVWGGESPYGVEETLNDQANNPDSVFKGVSVEREQPGDSKVSWRAGMPTVPGFDCSGFVWWVFRHSSVGAFDQRLTASGYRELGKKIGTPVCEGVECFRDFIEENAKPGDVVFIDPCERGVCHVAIYVGNGEIAESVGSIDGNARGGLIIRTIPSSYFDTKGIDSVYRFPITPSRYSFSIPSSPESFGESERYGFNSGDVLRGIYSVNPSFKIDFGVSFDFFNKSYDGSAALGEKCAALEDLNLVKGAALSDCVKDNAPSFNLSQNCASEDEDLLFGFAESLSNCAKSIDSGCSCAFDLSDEIEIIGLSENSTNISFNELSYEIPIKIALGKGFVHALPLPLEDEFFAEKTDSGLLLVESSSLKSCRINDRTFKVCSLSDEKYPVIANGKPSFEKIPLRFAFDVPDRAAPRSVGTKVERVKDLVVVLSWNESVSPDIAGFRIYRSSKDFSAPVEGFASVPYSPAKPFVSLDDVVSNKGVLFYDGSRYFFATVAPLKGTFFFGVAPFDAAGNSLQTISTVSATV